MPCCCAVNCSSRPERGFAMFAIPQGKRDVSRRERWLNNIGRKDFDPTKRTVLCELHFTPDQFEPRILQEYGKKKLRPNAVPTLFPHLTAPKQEKSPPESHELPSKIPSEESLELDCSSKEQPVFNAKMHIKLEDTSQEQPFFDVIFKGNLEFDGSIQGQPFFDADKRIKIEDTSQVPPLFDYVLTTTHLTAGNSTKLGPAMTSDEHAFPPEESQELDGTNQEQPFFDAEKSIKLEYTSQEQTPCDDIPTTTYLTEGNVANAVTTTSSDGHALLAEKSIRLEATRQYQPFCYDLPTTTHILAENVITVESVAPPHEHAPSQKALLDRISELERLQEELNRKLGLARKRYLKSEREKDQLRKKLGNLFNDDQITSLERASARGVRWETDTLVKSLKVRLSCGSQGYSLLRDFGYPLPCERTLQRHVAHINGSSETPE
ncbi:uncharacterized protein LOC135387422 isoform X2 [Ornithodoros turicata]|uniref:uncharacterized protein LOC135387422 isoform X2 n=1 Tax=Ornithodoros turicata TaxID=34597 RepID=UPI003138AB53